MYKIKVIYRSCPDNYNSIYPNWFNKEKSFLNLIRTMNNEDVNITVFFDGTSDSLFSQELLKYDIIYGSYGSDFASYQAMIHYIEELEIDDNTIVYLLEDDYLHKRNWDRIMIEAFDLFNPDFLTLYDHPDKYMFNSYKHLQSKIIISKNVHWRSIPSTTNTFAFKMKTFRQNINIFKKYWLDHEKFIQLWDAGYSLYSPMPGISTHCVEQYLAPLTDWEKEIL